MQVQWREAVAPSAAPVRATDSLLACMHGGLPVREKRAAFPRRHTRLHIRLHLGSGATSGAFVLAAAAQHLVHPVRNTSAEQTHPQRDAAAEQCISSVMCEQRSIYCAKHAR
jgi:hypothetical protein